MGTDADTGLSVGTYDIFVGTYAVTGSSVGTYAVMLFSVGTEAVTNSVTDEDVCFFSK